MNRHRYSNPSGLAAFALATVLAAAALAGLLNTGGCAGSLARQHVLAPTIDAQAVDVLRFARTLTHDEEAATAFDLARGKRDWAGALAVWPLVQKDALAGIAAGPESKGVKESFVEQVNRLDASLRKAAASGI